MNNNNLPQISYIALLGPRDKSVYTNIPPMSIVSPMLRYLGNLPQSMFQFVYGVEYYESVKENGLQLGYDLKFIYPDIPSDSIERLLLACQSPIVILLCTDDKIAIQTYNSLFAGKLDSESLCILYKEVEPEWTVQCCKASNEEEVWEWFYNYAIQHYDIDQKRLPFTVPILQKEVHDTGYVFSPSRVNTQIINSILGNWGYSRQPSNEDHERERIEASAKALSNKDGYDRQDLLIEQIKRIWAIETMVASGLPNIKDFEDQYRAPLIIAIPYTSIEMRKFDRSAMTKEESEMADFIESVLGCHYTKNYTIWNKNRIFKSVEQLTAFQYLQKSFLEPRMNFFDLVGLMHCSFRFSPYLRLPLMGKNINLELSFVGIKNIEKLATSPSKNKSIRKVMEIIGRKIVKEAIAPSVVTYLEKGSMQIVAMTDLPVEWLMVNDVPLGFSHDVCRIPETPVAGILSQYVEQSYLHYIIPKDILKHTLVIFGNEEKAFVDAQKPVLALSKTLGFAVRKCLTKESFFTAVEEFDPQLLIIDTHGGVDGNTHKSFLMFGNDVLNGDDIIISGIHPRLVFLSACNTFNTYNTIATIANAFFQVGSLAVTTSYMPVMVQPATTLYIRLLNNLHIAANKRIHKNWLSFMSHLLRTSYIQAPIDNVNKKGIEPNLYELTSLTTQSMHFKNRREIYKNLNNNSFTKGMGANYQNIIPHYLMYSTLGRADMIRFEVSLDFLDGINEQDSRKTDHISKSTKK